MSKHTPGPWEVADHGRFISIVTPNRALLASIRLGGFVSDCEAKANARLIAAAPQLLATLETIITMIPEGFVMPEGSNRLSNVAATAAHAISLATEEKL